jgi:hypothetical protein
VFYLQMIEPGRSGLLLICAHEQHKPLRQKWVKWREGTHDCID